MKYTAIFRKVPEGYVAYVKELPGANTQGATLEETRENLQEAVRLILETRSILDEHPTDEDPDDPPPES